MQRPTIRWGDRCREAIRRVNEGFIQIISEIPGFAAYYLVDAGGGVMISVSVFQDRASAEESNARASDYVRENLASVLPNPPQITCRRSCRAYGEIGLFLKEICSGRWSLRALSRADVGAGIAWMFAAFPTSR